MQNARNTGLIRFGVYELKKDTGELRKQGIKVRLQGKPVQLLQALLERPGDVVTRDELQKRLWPADTVVDFESGLNTAANRLRLALGDSAEHPHYVETVARIGYRFVAPVEDTDAPASSEPVIAATDVPPAARSRTLLWILLTTGVVVVAVSGAVIFRQRPTVQPSFHQLTFRRMFIGSSRFGPDGQTIIYEGLERIGNRDLYLTHPSSPESRPLGFQRCTLASISRVGELALIQSDRGAQRQLLRVPLNGGAPLVCDRGISAADWTADGRNMAVIRGAMYPSIIEYPRGKAVYQSAGWLSDLRVSPDGSVLAFMEHPIRGDDGGSVKLVDAKGASRTLSDGWASAAGLAWAPSGREVWFTAARAGVNRSLCAVDLAGRVRLIGSFPGTLRLFDISQSGRVLISRDETRMAMNGALNGEATEKDLSWFDYSRVTDISEDGRVVLFDESGEGGGPHYSAYCRRAEAGSATRLGEGIAMAISPDGKWAITVANEDRRRLTLVPLSSGDTRTISGHGLTYDWVRIFPDGTRLLAGGTLPGSTPALFTQTLDGSKPQRINANTYLSRPVISPDGKLIAGIDAQTRLVILPVEGGEPKPIPLGFYGAPLRWSSEGTSLLVQKGGMVPADVFRVDIRTGKYELWKEIAPPDLVGVMVISPAVISRDGKSYAYSFNRTLSELFAVDGWL
jgi:DNA-binding winged helix-turn-helix (wHTH) protein/Tol biopolymer transport system component